MKTSIQKFLKIPEIQKDIVIGSILGVIFVLISLPNKLLIAFITGVISYLLVRWMYLYLNEFVEKHKSKSRLQFISHHRGYRYIFYAFKFTMAFSIVLTVLSVISSFITTYWITVFLTPILIVFVIRCVWLLFNMREICYYR